MTQHSVIIKLRNIFFDARNERTSSNGFKVLQYSFHAMVK